MTTRNHWGAKDDCPSCSGTNLVHTTPPGGAREVARCPDCSGTDTRPSEDLEAGHWFRHNLLPRADVHGPYPLWHGWALMEAFLAGVNWGRTHTPARPGSGESAYLSEAWLARWWSDQLQPEAGHSHAEREIIEATVKALRRREEETSK